MSYARLLRNIPILEKLAGPDLDYLEKCLTKRRYSAGQIIFHMGDEGGNLYIINSGRVKITLPSPHGEEVFLTILSGGEILGELSFIDGKPRSATVQALVETEILCLSRKDFLDFLRDRFDVSLRVLEVLAQRLRDTDNLVAESYFLNITSRLAKKILDLGQSFGISEKNGIRIGVRVTQRDLASMVGATRESVNKQLKVLREQGIIDLGGGHITILDPEKLLRRTHTEE